MIGLLWGSPPLAAGERREEQPGQSRGCCPSFSAPTPRGRASSSGRRSRGATPPSAASPSIGTSTSRGSVSAPPLCSPRASRTCSTAAAPVSHRYICAYTNPGAQACGGTARNCARKVLADRRRPRRRLASLTNATAAAAAVATAANNDFSQAHLSPLALPSYSYPRCSLSSSPLLFFNFAQLQFTRYAAHAEELFLIGRARATAAGDWLFVARRRKRDRARRGLEFDLNF